ncbi:MULTISPECIES: M20 aminoacylase family protein [unclassified Pseudovibrio]|uniref:M20 aminoacylase family protein n=1 Tax=unclassified Pseudovibrio TaxID=2627060 RepID=UPI0007AEC796|nr:MULTISPECIES: M20 aminoacylase family protein [unclassified Pseudovibrio]KZK98099.1 putative hydrolase YxeP [Pseudovibrio sp. Ad5]KZL00868.1 putative hydrolase YxeP [Pseudovibrio sp. W74]KZL04442.1 putative hydrolase YxeP [Pseudovibrio sp. Ad14]
MPTINRLAEMHDEITAWRRDFHEHPEVLYETHRTSAKVAEILKEIGVDEVTTGVGRTGVVGVIKGRNGGAGKSIALRADMDALPMAEETGKEYASKNEGAMHACGHDGHTAMLLGTAKYLAETRNFDGTVILVFQPAEEGGAGAKAMMDDGLFTRWNVDEIYGLHNQPGTPIDHFATRSGPLMASTDEFTITVKGVGGHAAYPHNTIDPVVVGSQIVSALQSIASRNVGPLQSIVISVTFFQAGTAYNIIPDTAKLGGTIRTLDQDVRKQAAQRVKQVVEGVCAANGAGVDYDFADGYPSTSNHPDQTKFATQIAAEIAGSADKVDENIDPTMGGEDFAYYLEEKPGAFIFLGNGESAGLHHPKYDFNDEAIPYGCSYFIKLIETAMPAT